MRRTALVVACTVAVVPTVAAGVIEVGPGQSIQSAIDAASEGDHVVVGPGTYAESIDLLGKSIVVRSAEGPDVTAIDASGIGGSVVRCTGGEGPGTILQGFTLTGGTGTVREGDSSQYASGGGLFIVESSPTILHCRIEANSAIVGGGLFLEGSLSTIADCRIEANSAELGGGLSIREGGPRLTDCTIVANAASIAGGLETIEAAAVFVDCQLVENLARYESGGGGVLNGGASTWIDCTFERNLSEDNGGGLVTAGSHLLAGCTFTGNTSDWYGGAVMVYAGHLVAVDCQFVGNRAESKGGGIMVDYDASAAVIECAFAENEAQNGGALNLYFGRGDILGCSFDGNQALSGGAVWIFNVFDDHLGGTLDSCSFSGNHATRGGAVYLSDGTATPWRIRSCAFDANVADTTGGAVHVVRGHVKLEDSTLTGNAARDGGALHNRSSDLLMNGCTLRENVTPLDEGRGGAVRNEECHPTISACVFERNAAAGGGGMDNADSDPLVAACSFIDGTADQGGGIRNMRSSPIVTNCLFRGNRGRGMHNADGSDARVKWCTFSGDGGTDDGGRPIRTSGGMYNEGSAPTVIGCVFRDNVAESGAGLRSAASSLGPAQPRIERCIFDANVAAQTGGGIAMHAGSVGAIVSCLFVGNGALLGGGLFDEAGSSIVNATFSGNWADSGGGLYASDAARGTIANTVLWGNDARDRPEVRGGPAVAYRACDIRGSGGSSGWDAGLGFDAGGNIDADPLFAAAPVQLELSAGSPAVDRGDNGALPPGASLDLVGRPRRIDDPRMPDGGFGAAPIVDMGAFERTACAGDLTGDGVVDVADVVAVILAWGPCPGVCTADVNGDGAVDVDDLIEVVVAWGACRP